MKDVKGKLFWKVDSITQKITCLTMDESIEYYNFLKKCHSDGFRQIIVTSEIMIKLIEYFVLESNYTLYSIDFMEEDKELEEEIQSLLEMCSNNVAYLSKVIEKLHFLSEKSSIDIQRIYFKGRDAENNAIKYFIQSNGIVGINEKHFLPISKEISNLIERCLF